VRYSAIAPKPPVPSPCKKIQSRLHPTCCRDYYVGMRLRLSCSLSCIDVTSLVMTKPTSLPEHSHADSQPLGLRANGCGKYDSLDLKVMQPLWIYTLSCVLLGERLPLPASTNIINYVSTSQNAEVVSNQMVSRLRHSRGTQVDCEAGSSDRTLCFPRELLLAKHVIGTYFDQELQAYWVKYIDQANISICLFGLTDYAELTQYRQCLCGRPQGGFGLQRQRARTTTDHVHTRRGTWPSSIHVPLHAHSHVLSDSFPGYCMGNIHPSTIPSQFVCRTCGIPVPGGVV
jgi:hypothetical protein